MSVITLRVNPSLRRRLVEIVRERGYRSLSEALNEAIRNFVNKETRWKSRREVYKYFSRKKKTLRGLEEVHEEEEA